MNTPPGIRIAIWLWFFAALAAGSSGFWRQFPFSVLGAALLGLTALLVFAHRLIPAFRAWVEGLSLRALVLLHATRFVTLSFFVLHQRGELALPIALPGGLGGCLVATLALLLAFVPLSAATRLRAVYVWNVLGIADILLVMLSARRFAAIDPTSLLPFTQLPLSLLPTFLLPLLLATHLAIFARLRAVPV